MVSSIIGQLLKIKWKIDHVLKQNFTMKTTKYHHKHSDSVCVLCDLSLV
jgi:hypothetical protein